MLFIQTLGELSVTRSGKTLPLPPSKKTRALLSYLLLTERPHRRERLCELLWDVPDDPRGALRWSLSKLRIVINEPDVIRLTADRERVEVETADIHIDIRSIEKTLKQKNISPKSLREIAEKLNEPMLEGMDLPNHDQFQNWLTAERNSSQKLLSQVAKMLANNQSIPPEEVLEWSRVWLQTSPFDASAGKQVITILSQLGYNDKAQELLSELDERFRKAGVKWGMNNGNFSKKPHETNELSPDRTKLMSQQLLKRQKIQFCMSKDKVKIAYATVGDGPPLVKAANWLSHLELDWDAPIWSPIFRELAQDHHFIRYDERGNGLSDWDVEDISFNAFVEDLETIVDSLGLKKFPLLGISQGAAVSIEYAVRHPERVSHLVLFGAYASGWRINATPKMIKEREAIMALTETGWGQDNPAYRQIFSSTFMPSASANELNWFNDFQRQTTSPENAVLFQSAFGDIDVRHQLSKISVPTLVIHSVGDMRIPVSSGRDIAAAIPNAEFVCLESDNHLLIGQEPASKVFIDTVREFIKQ